MKSDTQIKLLVEASIRRHGMHMATWSNTRLWDEGDPGVRHTLQQRCVLEDGELQILYSYPNAAQWTLFTTRRVFAFENGEVRSMTTREIDRADYGNFKGHRDQHLEWAVLTSRDGREQRCPYETGYPSMGTVYAIGTLMKRRP
jgi:hypothetical protein